MKLTSDLIKEEIQYKYGINREMFKRISKSKTENGQIVRVFSCKDFNNVQVLTDSKDENIIEISLITSVKAPPQTPTPVVRSLNTRNRRVVLRTLNRQEIFSWNHFDVDLGDLGVVRESVITVFNDIVVEQEHWPTELFMEQIERHYQGEVVFEHESWNNDDGEITLDTVGHLPVMVLVDGVHRFNLWLE